MAVTVLRPHVPPDAWLGALGWSLLILLVAACVAVWPPAGGGPSFAYPVKTLLVFGAGLWLVGLGWTAARVDEPVLRPGAQRFGPANHVTLSRLALTALLAGLIGESSAAMAWAIVGVATLSALLDGVDGAIARKTRTSSCFGARFDMETDALLVMVLSVLTALLGKAGWWVLASGFMRYAYVAAGRAWPWLAQPVPPSLLRKAICVVQIVLLILAISPVVTRPWSEWLAALGLVLLIYSFGRDIVWLARTRNVELPR